LVCGWFLFDARDPVSTENFHRIQLGMTRQQVEEIFGDAKRLDNGKTIVFWRYQQDSKLSQLVANGHYAVTVEFDEQGKVSSMWEGGISMPTGHSAWDYLPSWLRW
jgi:SmpA / OmlA family